jgi:hypothetical protein
VRAAGKALTALVWDAATGERLAEFRDPTPPNLARLKLARRGSARVCPRSDNFLKCRNYCRYTIYI